ncbi:MAG TPA: hypothetical protein VF210_19960 [Pseudomonadales bacterium]
MRRRDGLRAALLALALLAAPSFGYEPQVHQRLTFHAAKILNRCLEGSRIPPLTPLQVRFIATSNMGLANSNFLVRFFRWSYFDMADRDDRQLLWLINTRFLEHFEEVVAQMDDTEDATERYRHLGRIVSYVQLVGSPSRAVPVYAARFWRWSFADRFDDYAVDDQALEAALGNDCSFLDDPPDSYRAVLFEVARDTLDAVRSPMGGLPATWEAFWQLGEEPGDFGDYGPAGNSFGEAVEFPCTEDPTQRCVLLEDDPLYTEFALARQVAAVQGTARAMFLHQLRFGEPADEPGVARSR